MKRLIFKLGLFICIWYEIATELRIDGDTAFLVGIAAFCVSRFAVRIAGHALGMFGPSAFGLLVQTALWAVLFWCFTPTALRELPLLCDITAFTVLGIAGARSRQLFERERLLRGAEFWRVYSGVLVAGILGTLLIAMTSLRQSGSIWPLLAYVLLVLIPAGFGWRMVGPVSPERADAKVGDRDDFKAAGLSEER